MADNRSQQIFMYDDEAHTANLIEARKHLDQLFEQMLIEGHIVIVKSSLGQSNSIDFMDQVQLDLVVVQDSIGDLLPNGQLALNTHTLQTRAVVGFGQTLVMGGVLYQQQLDRLLVSPALSGLPFVWQWFKQHKQGTGRLELLVFVTPHIVTP